MKRFIIIDHSLCNLQGHHYECSVSVAKASARLGYQPLIIANRVFSSDFPTNDIEILPCFQVDWFDNPILGDQKSSRKEKIRQFLAGLRDHPFEKLTEIVEEKIGNQIDYFNLTQPKFRLLLEKIQGSTYRLSQWFNKDIQRLEYIPFANTFWGIFKIILGLIRYILKVILNKSLSLLNGFTEIHYESFQESLVKVFDELAITSEDQILIHTLGIHQVEDIHHFLQSQSLEKLPQFHLLLRRDIDDPLVKNVAGMGLGACFNGFIQSNLWPNKVKFYTDTRELVERYNSLSLVELIQVPVPFQTEKIKKSLDKQPEQPIHIVYLGDARYEKGYHHLPKIVSSLWEDYLSQNKVKFTIQSNFSVEGGETGILEARLQLEQYPTNQVRLVKEVMQTEDYYQLLNSADIVILPYDQISYQYRTSGVLTESLAAGKPVIVPNNTWLGRQVDNTRGRIYNDPHEIGDKVKEVLQNLERFQVAAQAFSHQWLQQNTPETFLKCLLSQQDFKLENELLNDQDHLSNFTTITKILFILEGESLSKQRILDHLVYFFKQGYQVSLMTFTHFPSYRGGNYDQFYYTVKEIIDKFAFEKVWILDHDIYPCLPSEINPKIYLQDVKENKESILQDLVNYHSLTVEDSVLNFLENNPYDLVYTHSSLILEVIKRFKINSQKIVCEVENLLTYQYAMINHQEIDPLRLDQEKAWLKQFTDIITLHPHQVDKLKEWGMSSIYWISENNYYNSMNQCLSSILGNQALRVNKGINIAILYPWGDILERKSGASQRVGLLTDYLIEEGYNLWVFTTGKKQEFYQNKIHYSYYEQKFTELELINEIYQDAYQNWQNVVNLDKIDQFDNLSVSDHWLPWIYYQYRFDFHFKQQIKKIVEWADIVILEYPFWAAIVGEICQEKGVKLMITAHDVLSQQLPENSYIRKIALAEEINGLKQADILICVSSEDQTFFKQYGLESVVIENPVNFPDDQILQTMSIDEKFQEKIKDQFCLFVGSQHLPNIEAVKHIRQIAKLTPSIQFIIVGSCCQSEEKDNFMALGKVSQVTLIYLYQKASIILSPLTSGTGSSLKVLEAMAYGKLILGTQIAFRGYPVTSQVNGWIEDNLSNYPHLIKDLLQDSDTIKTIGENAKQFAKTYDYRNLYQTYVKLLENDPKRS